MKDEKKQLEAENATLKARMKLIDDAVVAVKEGKLTATQFFFAITMKFAELTKEDLEWAEQSIKQAVGEK